jgi:TetR/AcrR family transcriptional repressor of nem operon
LGPRKTTTRERLIATAADLFRRQGYAQTGVNQIIQEANATSGSFYHFFSAKEDLLLAVVDHIAEVFEGEIFSPAAVHSDGPLEEIFEILALYRQQLQNDGFTFASPMAALSAEVSENHPEVRARLAEVLADWTRHIEELIGDAGNRLSTTVDRPALAQHVVCAMEGAVLGTRLERSLGPFDATVAQLRAYFNLLTNQAGTTGAGPMARPRVRVTTTQKADWRSW